LNNADRAIALGRPRTSLAHKGSIDWLASTATVLDVGLVAMGVKKWGGFEVSAVVLPAATVGCRVPNDEARVPNDNSRVPIDAGPFPGA
jgi:hypothetical protein